VILPIRRLQEGTREIADGGFGTVLQVDASRELQQLSEALSMMSASLADYRAQREEQLARLRAANEELRAAQEALVRSERLAGVGRMAAGLAHEVGNPLAVVLGYLELMAGGLDDADLEQDLVRRSQKELGRIHAIIRQLLDYSRTGEGRPEVISLAEAARDAVETVSPQPSFRGVMLSVEIETDGTHVRVERDKLQQVLVNLLLNAGDALLGDGERSIVLQVVGDGAEAQLRCLDSGTGFDPVALDRAFEPFFTTRDVGRGTGLGLATALQVIEQAGGRMWVRNREDRGAEVGLALPRVGEELDVA